MHLQTLTVLASMVSRGEAAIVVSWSEADMDLAGYCGS